MGRGKTYTDNIIESNISVTAYRALLVLGLLMTRPYSRDEIVKVLKNNPITSRSFSLDTVRVTINTLKASGCMISRPTPKNNYCYTLISHPFGFGISKPQAECLNFVRKNLVNLEDWRLILAINDFYNRIAGKTNDLEIIQLFKNAEPLSDVKKDVLKVLSKETLKGKEVTISYESSNYGLEDLVIIPDKIFYENSKLYLWCFIKKYNDCTYLRFDKIKEVKVVGVEPQVVEKKVYQAFYKIGGDSALTYRPMQNEFDFNRNEDLIEVNVEVENEFKFVQRLLSFGADLIDVKPVSLKKKILFKLEKLLKEYEDE